MPYINDSSYGALVVCSATKKVLLIKQRCMQNSYWALPKGHKNPGETDLEAAIREVNEECGLALTKDEAQSDVWSKECYQYRGTLHDDAWLKHADYPNPKKRPTVAYNKSVYYTLVKVDSELLTKHQATEVDAAAWFPVHEAYKVLKHEAQRRVLLTLFSKV